MAGRISSGFESSSRRRTSLPRASSTTTAGTPRTSPSPALEAGFKKVGEQLTADWLKKAGAEGQAVIDAYKKM